MKNQITSDDDLLTEVDAARILSIEPRTVRLWRRTRGLPHLKLTKKIVRIRRADLQAWVSRHLVQTVA